MPKFNDDQLVKIFPPGDRKPPVEGTVFVTDAWLAAQLYMATATVRSQRWKRLHGLDHWLDLDPVYIGSKPRYRRSEAIAWLQGQARQNTIKQ